jgi:hypothetical protein
MPETSDQERWTALAEIARGRAARAQNESARQEALDVARAYERVVRQAELLMRRTEKGAEASR